MNEATAGHRISNAMEERLATLLAGLVFMLACATALASSSLNSVTAGSQTPNPISPGASATFAITVTRTGAGKIDIDLSDSGLPAGATASFSPGRITFKGNSPTSASSILTVRTTNSIPLGAYAFTVRAQDAGGSTAKTGPATLWVTVNRPVISMTRLADGNMGLIGAGTANAQYRIQATTSLAAPAWTTIATRTADVQGRFNFTDLSATNYSCRFYRTSTP
jgi:hypothetical protein